MSLLSIQTWVTQLISKFYTWQNFYSVACSDTQVAHLPQSLYIVSKKRKEKKTHIDINKWVSEWFLFNANITIFQLFHGENNTWQFWPKIEFSSYSLMFNMETTNTNLIVFHLNQPGMKSKIYCIYNKHANHLKYHWVGYTCINIYIFLINHKLTLLL